jgi:hypothetical protein
VTTQEGAGELLWSIAPEICTHNVQIIICGISFIAGHGHSLQIHVMVTHYIVLRSTADEIDIELKRSCIIFTDNFFKDISHIHDDENISSKS